LAGRLGSGSVPANLRLTAGNVYEISGRVDVGTDRGAAGTAGVAASLTIDAGVTLFGDSAADMLIVNRGSQIFVNGTAAAPVIMTSLGDAIGSRPDAGASREWAGLIILGRAPIRGCNTAVTQGTVDCQNAVEGVTAATGNQALYGGAAADDNSGRITYLQIRYPGAFLTSAAAGDDLNGLTLGGVGSGTVIDFVQIHNSGDDGVEIFGGLARIKHLVITGALDDSLDCDEGWQGRAQFVIIRQDAASGGPDKLVECSNRTVASAGGGLNTNPTIANYTFVGQATSSSGAALIGIDLNTSGGQPGASGQFLNGVVTGSSSCLRVQEPGAQTSPAPTFNSTLFDCPAALSGAAATAFGAGSNNSTATANTLTSTFINGANENARTAIDPATIDPWFTSTSWIGAVRNSGDTWWVSWTCNLAAGTSC
jgi:hypothetical protein